MPHEFFDREPPDPRRDAARAAEPHVFEAERVGALPADGPAVVGGVELPSGWRTLPESSREPALWLTDAPVPETGPAWLALANSFTETGLWPIVSSAG